MVPTQQYKIVKLSEIADFKTGRLNANAAVEGGEYPFFTCSRESFRTNTWAFDCECVLLAGNNANAEYPVKYFKGKFDAYQRTYVITAKDSKYLNIRYLYYCIELKLNLLKSLSTGSATRFLTKTILDNLEFHLPEKRTQDKIVNNLSSYDNLVGNNNRRIAILEEMAQSLYREWFVNFRYPGHADDTKNSESADENCDAVTGKNSNKPTLIDSPLGPIPEGWEVKNAIEIFNINIGKTPPRKQSQWFSSKEYGVKWVSIKDMGNNQIFVLETKECLVDEAIDKFKVKVIPADTVVMSFKLTVGKVAITSENMCTNEAIAHFNIKDNSVICREYIYLYLKGFAFQTLGNTSSIGNAINSQIVKSMPIVLPTSKIMDSFSELVSPIFANLLTLAKRNRNLKKQRDMLLPKLISGQIELKD